MRKRKKRHINDFLARQAKVKNIYSFFPLDFLKTKLNMFAFVVLLKNFVETKDEKQELQRLYADALSMKLYKLLVSAEDLTITGSNVSKRAFAKEYPTLGKRMREMAGTSPFIYGLPSIVADLTKQSKQLLKRYIVSDIFRQLHKEHWNGSYELCDEYIRKNILPKKKVKKMTKKMYDLTQDFLIEQQSIKIIEAFIAMCQYHEEA